MHGMRGKKKVRRVHIAGGIRRQRRGGGLWSRYRMTEEDYQRMLNPKCGAAICGKDGELHVDHCHDTSMVRGLL